MNLALFALDGTLLRGDSDHAFGEFLITQGLADGEAHRRRNDEFYEHYVAGTLDIHDYVAFCTAPWRVLPAEEQQRLHQRFMDEVVERMLEAPAIALVERHRAAGDLMALVTATNDFVTAPIARRLGIDTLIATDLSRDAEGRYTGAIAGTPSFRDGKITRVQAWLATLGRTLASFESSTFYSDSTNDLPLLERVTNPVATNPGPALHEIAQARGWPILNLFA